MEHGAFFTFVSIVNCTIILSSITTSNMMHATRSQADAVVRYASGLCEAKIGAEHSEQGSCMV